MSACLSFLSGISWAILSILIKWFIVHLDKILNLFRYNMLGSCSLAPNVVILIIISFFVEIWNHALLQFIITVEVYPILFAPSQECWVSQSNLKTCFSYKWKIWWGGLKIWGTLLVESCLRLRELPGKKYLICRIFCCRRLC